MLQALHLPVCRDLSKPHYARVLHGHGGVEALGDGAGDDGLALLLQQGDQLLLLSHQCVDLAGLAVEEGGYGCLLGNRGKTHGEVTNEIVWDTFLTTCTIHGSFAQLTERR